MTKDELETIFSQEGLYILTHNNLPGATNAVLSMGGRAFQISLREDMELSRDLAVWADRDAIRLVGGPFSEQTIAQAREAVGEMKGLLIQCALVLTGVRDFMKKHQDHDGANHAQNLLSHIAELTEGESGEYLSEMLPPTDELT